MTDRDELELADNDDVTDTEPDESVANGPVETDEQIDDTDARVGDDLEQPEITAESDNGDTAPVDDEPDPAVINWQQSTGAFVLGTLDPADAAAAARVYSSSTEMQKELVSILPVADILTSLYQSQSPIAQATGRLSIGSSPSEAASGAAPAAAGNVQTKKTQQVRSQPVAIPTSGGLSKSTLVMAGLGLLAAIGILWALAQRDQISTKDQEISALRSQVAELQQGGNASVFVLNPVSDEAASARATVFYSPGDGTVLIDGSGLPGLDDDRVYQVWLQASGSSEWHPGPTFRANSSGEVVGRLAGDTPGFARMAVSEEPAPGSAEPSGDFLLEGELVRTDSPSEPESD